MREIPARVVTEEVARMCIEANIFLPPDVYHALVEKEKNCTSPSGHAILEQILENARIARDEEVPICQDTGYTVVFVEIGQDLHITGGGLTDAINAGVAKGYSEGYLRKSIVSDPIRRVNTGDNTPAVIYYEIVPGEHLHMTVVPKGGGAENMSHVAMLKPSDGIEGIKEFVVETVREAGGNPCPPIVVGVGIGGTFERCTHIAKKALLRRIGSKHPDDFYADLERDLHERIDNIGVGPMGLGGFITVLAVHVEVFPCHIASLPVAVNINCHAARHTFTEL
jgi:fumarate hydratase subunit alpha